MKRNKSKTKAAQHIDLPKEARWRLEEATLKARPLCDALALLEDAIYGTIDDASWLVSNGELSQEQFYPAADSYREDAIESARARLEIDGGYDGVPEHVDELVKRAVDLLTKKQ